MHNTKDQEESIIPRSSNLDRAIFAAKSLTPKLLSKGPLPYLIHPISKHNRDMLTLNSCLLDNSKTFALTLQVMNDLPEVREDLILAHQGFKGLDYIDETETISGDEKKELMDQYLRTIEDPGPNGERIGDLENRLLWLGFNEKDEEHKSLIQNVPTLVRAFRDRYSEIRKVFINYASKMAEGFTRVREKGEVVDFGDVDRDCLIAAGYVGYLVNAIYEARGIISSEQAEKLKGPSRTVGKALQLGNNLRDLFEDMNYEIKHWPDRIMEKINKATTAADISDLILKSREATVKEVYENEFKELIDYTTDKFLKATEYTDKLPADKYKGHILFPALSLAGYSLVTRNVDNEDFLMTRGRSYRLDKSEVFDAKDVVTHLVNEGRSIRPYLEHILIAKRPSREYRG